MKRDNGREGGSGELECSYFMLSAWHLHEKNRETERSELYFLK
jgi:hypothetical protein